MEEGSDSYPLQESFPIFYDNLQQGILCGSQIVELPPPHAPPGTSVDITFLGFAPVFLALISTLLRPN